MFLLFGLPVPNDPIGAAVIADAIQARRVFANVDEPVRLKLIRERLHLFEDSGLRLRDFAGDEIHSAPEVALFDHDVDLDSAWVGETFPGDLQVRASCLTRRRNFV